MVFIFSINTVIMNLSFICFFFLFLTATSFGVWTLTAFSCHSCCLLIAPSDFLFFFHRAYIFFDFFVFFFRSAKRETKKGIFCWVKSLPLLFLFFLSLSLFSSSSFHWKLQYNPSSQLFTNLPLLSWGRAIHVLLFKTQNNNTPVQYTQLYHINLGIFDCCHDPVYHARYRLKQFFPGYLLVMNLRPSAQPLKWK